jgi:hypothetical protein
VAAPLRESASSTEFASISTETTDDSASPRDEFDPFVEDLEEPAATHSEFKWVIEPKQKEKWQANFHKLRRKKPSVSVKSVSRLLELIIDKEKAAQVWYGITTDCMLYRDCIGDSVALL